MKNKYNIFLDLDETIISAIEFENYDKNKLENDKRKNNFTFYTMGKDYIVFERPHLQEFLDYLFENFNVSIWTAASKIYALFIIQNIVLKKPNRKLDYIFFSYHCDLSEKFKNGLKDLSLLWDTYKLPKCKDTNTVIIDDNPDVKKTGFCISAPEFIFTNINSENDTFLIELTNKLKKIN